MLFIFFFLGLASGSPNEVLIPREEPVMTVTEMIEYWGYPVEEHRVTTDDGYILTMHRIPYGKDGPFGQDTRPPVFMGHCLLCTSSIFSFGPPERDIAYMLADAGYDVWMGNTRGNTWSQDHVSLSPEDPEFWNFDWGTTGEHDYPAEIDYVLDNTGNSDLFFVGYSMGTTQYMVFLSEKPEYNDKIRAGFLLAPPVFMGNAFAGILEALSPIADRLVKLGHNLGIYEFLPHRQFYSVIGHAFCSDDYPVALADCVSRFGNFIPEELLDPSMLSFYLDHLPGGASLEMLSHYAQLYLNPDKFVKFDFGSKKNLEMYGQEDPPEYDLSKVTAPTALFVGDSDGLASVPDNDLLASILPNLIDYQVVDYEGWTHLTFFSAINSADLIYTQIIGYMDDLS